MLLTVPTLPPRCCWIARDAVPPLLPAHPSCSVAIDQLCVHECHVVGKGGQYWPQPTFKVRWLGGGGGCWCRAGRWASRLLLQCAAWQTLAAAGCDAVQSGIGRHSTTSAPALLFAAFLLQVVATDRPNEPLIAKSCTGCWTGVSTCSLL